MTEPTQMSLAELDEAVATEVCGWNLSHIRGPNGCMYHPDDKSYRDPWMPSSSISDAFSAEGEIERRLLSAAYAENLLKIAWRGKSGRSTWYLIHASPLARCLAMLETARAAKEGKP